MVGVSFNLDLITKLDTVAGASKRCCIGASLELLGRWGVALAGTRLGDLNEAPRSAATRAGVGVSEGTSSPGSATVGVLVPTCCFVVLREFAEVLQSLFAFVKSAEGARLLVVLSFSILAGIFVLEESAFRDEEECNFTAVALASEGASMSTSSVFITCALSSRSGMLSPSESTLIGWTSCTLNGLR